MRHECPTIGATQRCRKVKKALTYANVASDGRIRVSALLVSLCFSVGSSLFTAASATQGVACGSPVDSRPPEQLKYSGLEFHLAACVPR